MSRRKTVFTPKELLERFSAYLESCDASGWKPTWEGFGECVGLPSSALLAALGAAEDEPGFDPKMSEALRKIQDGLVNRLLQRSDSMAVLCLKQPRYGGYADKPAASGNDTLRIEFTIRGMDAPPPEQ